MEISPSDVNLMEISILSSDVNLMEISILSDVNLMEISIPFRWLPPQGFVFLCVCL
jgi:hypothetical protein